MEDEFIFVGDKPFMNYVTGVVMQFTTKEAPKVVIKARGRFIGKAVDVAEVAKNRFLAGQVDVREVRIGSEEFTSLDGKTLRASKIEVELFRL